MPITDPPVSLDTGPISVCRTAPVSLTVKWKEVVGIGGLINADSARVTTPTVDCNQDTTFTFSRQGQVGTTLVFQLKYLTASTVNAPPKLAVFGFDTDAEGRSSGGPTRLSTKGGLDYVTFAPDSSLDPGDGTYSYCTATLENFVDTLGLENFFVGIEEIFDASPNPELASLLVRCI